MKPIKLKVKKIVSPIFTQEELDVIADGARDGNLSCKLDLILHNQRLLYEYMKSWRGSK